MTKNSCIITSASDKFFPSLLNLLGSIEVNYKNHPEVYVYDLGLFITFRKELEKIPWVHIVEVPHFVPHWRACYTWKTYILNTPLADLNLYIDAGCQVLTSLDPLFEKIESQGYMAVSQGPNVHNHDVTPQEFIDLYKLDNETLQKEVITAGIFGFKKESIASKITNKLYEAGINKQCLGFSKTELWKNKGVNKTEYVRDCKIFRHDTTLLSVLLQKEIPHAVIEPIENFSSKFESRSSQLIWNFRLNYKKLPYVSHKHLHPKLTLIVALNRIYIHTFIFTKKIINKLK